MTKKIEVESLKALEPGKVYAIEVLSEEKDVWDQFYGIVDYFKKEHGIELFIYHKGDIKFIPPEAMEDGMAEKFTTPNCKYGNLCCKKHCCLHCKKKTGETDIKDAKEELNAIKND